MGWFLYTQFYEFCILKLCILLRLLRYMHVLWQSTANLLWLCFDYKYCIAYCNLLYLSWFAVIDQAIPIYNFQNFNCFSVKI